jgi:thiol-disulfide isomerase/thioredoxin
VARSTKATAFLASVLISGVIVFSGAALWNRTSADRSKVTFNPNATPAFDLPAFDLPDLQTDSKRYSLGSFGGKPLVINVFDYTCVPCIRELPMISEVAAANPDVAVLGVHLMLQRDDAQAFVKKLNLSFPVAYDGEGEFATSIASLPTTIFLDAKGREVGRVTGPIAKDDLTNRLQRLRRGIS